MTNSLTVLNKPVALERMSGDEELYGEVVAVFLEDMPLQFEQLRNALSAANQKDAARIVHSVKSAAASVGGESLSDCARKMEELARAGDLTSVKNMVQTLEQRFEALRQELNPT